MTPRAINVGLLGCGVIGGGVAKVLLERSDLITERIGRRLRLAAVAELDQAKPRMVGVPDALVTTDLAAVVDNPEIDVVVELMGGESPALECMQRAIINGKHVVTANKLVIARHGPALFAMAEEHGVDIYFEASVGGGIPVIAPFKQSLVVNRIQSIKAIINGTTNYILTKMAEEDWTFEAALKQAQAMGFAEANPESDVQGMDASFKLAILTSLGFRSLVHPDHIYREGITQLHPRDFRYARELGYALKLLAIGKESDGRIEVRVHPAFVPQSAMLAQVNGVFNAIQVEGDLTGPVLFYGRGAGPEPTSSAVVSDILDIANNINAGVANRLKLRLNRGLPIRPISDVVTRYYIRLQLTDGPGVLAQIAGVLGDRGISIASVVQKETFETQQTAEVVVMTHPAREAAVHDALEVLRRLPVVKETSNCIRVED